jgi:ribosomal protein S17E
MNRSHLITTLGEKIMKEIPSKISGDFEANKSLVDKILSYKSGREPEINLSEGPYHSTKFRNKVAGYITREYNKMQKHLQDPSYDPHGSHAPPKKKPKIGRYFRKHR